MNWKNFAKQFSFLYWLNSKIKSRQLKKELISIAREYKVKIEKNEYKYDINNAINTFKTQLQKYQPKFVPSNIGELKVFWVGANKTQDDTGFMQALLRFAKVTVFYNHKGDYGLWFGETNSDSTFSEIRKSNDEALLKQVHCAKNTSGIDVLLGQMWANFISKEALLEVQNMGIPVINIAMDDRLPIHWGFQDGVRLGSIGLSSSINMVLTTASETCQWYGVEDCPAIFWPLASDPNLFGVPKNAKRDIDVLFIGNRYGIRGKIVKYLEKRGIKVTCYGNGWPNGYVNAEMNIALSKRARIILGIGTIGHCADLYTLKLRDFDALMTGALYITHRNPDLCYLFKEGEEIECYVSPNEAAEKIQYYLSNDKERELIGYKGQLKAVANHSWEERLGSTFSQLGLLRL